MKRIVLLLSMLAFISGCDSIYRYVFLPDARLEYGILPDKEMISLTNDSSYSISADGMAVIYNAKSWKIEIRYMSDYQLNTFEFPDDSKQELFSGNPFTYANWVDPKLGYTPKRFSVFKVSIFNYTSQKINYDPQSSSLLTDRGDNLKAYAREKKEAKYTSMEEYFTKKKGKSGVEDDIFETRMGIARRNMLYLGKPIYKGDSREGLVVFDPVEEAVGKLKIDIQRFILSYDENNEPAEIKPLVFYFKQSTLSQEELQSREKNSAAFADTSSSDRVPIMQIKYNSLPGRIRYEESWNIRPQSIPNLISHIQRNTPYKVKYLQGSFNDAISAKAPLAMIFGNYLVPEFNSATISSAVEYIANGGVIFIDNLDMKEGSPYRPSMEELLSNLQKKVIGKAEIKKIEIDHQLFAQPKAFTQLPKGYDDQLPERERTYFLKGLFINGKLAVILSTRGYPLYWSEELSSNNNDQLDFGINLLNYALTNKKEPKK